MLFTFNEALLISDGVQARLGALTAGREWFMPWRTIEGKEIADGRLPQLQVMLQGVFDKRRFLLPSGLQAKSCGSWASPWRPTGFRPFRSWASGRGCASSAGPTSSPSAATDRT